MFAPAQFELLPTAPVPALLAPDARAKARTLEFFTAHIRNPNTRKAYARAGQHFADWCERLGIGDVRQVQPIHVALRRRVRDPRRVDRPLRRRWRDALG